MTSIFFVIFSYFPRYRSLFFTASTTDTIKPASSATGTAHQIPAAPKIIGNRIMEPARNKKVRAKDMIADAIPLDNAVNTADAKIPMPLNRKLMANIGNPASVMLYTFDPVSVNITSAGPMVNKEIT